MAKQDSSGESIGNKDDSKRGRGIKDGTAIGQKIPKDVHDKIKPKDGK